MTLSLKPVFVVLCLFATSLIGAESLPKESLSKQLSKEFVQVGKTAIPAVVSITVKLSKKAAQYDNGDDQGDFSQEEFWRRFFGSPGVPQKQDRKPQPVAHGSGFSVSEDGYILTNNHVVQDAESITVSFTDEKEYPAKLIGADPNTDVALLKIDAKGLPYLQLGNSDHLEIGEWVVAIGNPLGLQASLTVGHVSAKGRNDLDIARVEEFIQTDAAINRGNSGGPLLNLDKEVIGMNTAMVASSANGGHMGIGFAIPSNLIKQVMDELIKNGKIVRGFLGIMFQKVDNDIAEAFGLSKVEGALVTDIVKDGPADKAGIKAGDVIIKLNKQNIDNVGILRNTISFLHAEDVATVTVRRGDKEMEFQAVIGIHPESEMAEQEVQNSLGLLVEAITSEVKEQLGLTETKGVLIKFVSPNSAAQFAGLKRGQLILSVNRHAVTTPEEFYRTVQDRPSGSRILLHVKEGQATRFIILRAE